MENEHNKKKINELENALKKQQSVRPLEKLSDKRIDVIPIRKHMSIEEKIFPVFFSMISFCKKALGKTIKNPKNPGIFN